jgi:Predicted membrane protein
MGNKTKKKNGFPSAFTVLFIVLIFAAILTFIIPAGKYSTLVYDADNQVFVVTNPDESTLELPATQATLDKLGINADLDKFLNGTIYKPMAVSGTYVQLPQNGQGPLQVVQSPILGIYDSIDIILFVFMIGGCIGIVNYLGAFNAGIAALARVSKGREELIIVVVCSLIALGGTTFGMAEETIAFYPILIPIFLSAGYDAMVGIAAIYAGSSIGCMFSTVNAFSVVIASNAAGVSFKSGLVLRLIGLIIGLVLTLIYILRYAKRIKNDPTKSLIYADRDHIAAKFNVTEDTNHDDAPPLTFRYKLVLGLFFITFVIMIAGVSSWDWWFDQMSTLFLCSGIIIGIVGGLNEKDIAREFVHGASELIGVALIIGVARAVNMILENGLISDTLLKTMSGWVDGMNPVLFILIMMVVFIILGFFINSSSGLAVLSIPIMAPLADTVGLPREVVISAYIYGLGLIGYITPTGLVLASLELVDVTFDKWLKFITPLMGYLLVLGGVMLVVQIYM